MLVVDGTDVYEIDETCINEKKVPRACGTKEIYENLKKREQNRREPSYYETGRHRMKEKG